MNSGIGGIHIKEEHPFQDDGLGDEPYPDRTAESLNISQLTAVVNNGCLLYTSPSPRDQRGSRMPSSA